MESSSEDIPARPVCDLLDAAVARFPANPALEFLGRRWTYGELGAAVDKAAAGLRALGVRRGVRVGICLPNCPHFVIAYYAILRVGGTVVNFSPLYVERELAHQVTDSGTTIMITLDLALIYPKIAPLLNTTPLERIVVCRMKDALPTTKGLLFSVLKRAEVVPLPDDPRQMPFSALMKSGALKKSDPIDPVTEVAVLQYTGGTTGVPKGAMLTHANLTANVEQILRWAPQLKPGKEKSLCVIPFFHVFAMTVGMNVAVGLGAELIMLPRFDIDQVVDAIVKHRPTIFPGVPTIFTAINEAVQRRKADLSSITFCLSGGAPLPLDVRQTFERLSGGVLVEGYGLSETSPVATCNPVDRAPRDGSIGLPLHGTRVDIVDPADPDRVLGTNERGELIIHGPQVMAGYWGRPDDTAQVLVNGGLRTGDIGYRDDEGYLYLVDRIKDLILSGGYNVYPRVIEEALHRHPDVAEAVVIGVADPYRGQVPKAFVRLNDGSTVTPDDIKTFLKDQISPVEMPKLIEIRDQLPKTMVGKLSKKHLIDEENRLAAAKAASRAASDAA